MRRVVAMLAIASGLGLIVVTFAISAFLRTGDGERILDRFRVVTTPQGLAAFHADYVETTGAVGELVAKTYPRFTGDFGMSDAQFKAYVTSHYSAVASGVATIQTLPDLVNPVVSGIGALPDGGFEPVYDLPISALPLTSVPWLMLGLGLVLVAFGFAAWRLPGRLTTALVLASGIGMIVVPFAASLPSKVDDTARIIHVGDLGLSAEAATRSEQAAYAADAMVRQLDTNLLPAVAKRRGISTAALDQQLRTESPALSKLLRDWPAIAPRSFAFAAIIRESVAEFAEAKQFPFQAIPWLVISLGALLLLAAGAALVPGARGRKP
jgi:hypothetical protein